MHIGGMRTALFNWLWARHNGGQFILRIDDTDRERNVEEALQPILNAFRWLELDWDEGPEVGGPYGPYFQSQRAELYREAADRLLTAGKAYRDFDTSEQIQADREAAKSEGRNYLNIRRSLELTDEQIQQFVEEGRQYVVRFLVPRGEKIEIDDAVRGHVEWDAGLISDPVIVRSNGTPLYNFATVVDDAQLKITDVIRAEEHLSNTPTQSLLYQALGYEQPRFAHIPFVTAPGTTKKLSKRDIKKYRNNPKFKRMFDAGDTVFPMIGLECSETLNPVMVEYYQQIGYLPAGVLNGLARLGWSLDDKTEIFSRQELIDNFTLDRVVKNPAGLDPEKLMSYQVHWMEDLPVDEKVERCLPYLEQAGLIDSRDNDVRTLVASVVSGLGDRLKICSDILNSSEFFVADADLEFEEKAFNKRLRKSVSAGELLRKFRDRLAAAESFDAASLDKLLHDFVEAEDVKIGEIIHALRVAATGKGVGIGMFHALAILGRESCLARIDRALELL